MKKVIFLFFITAFIFSCSLGEFSNNGTLVVKLPGSSSGRSTISSETADVITFGIDCARGGKIEKSEKDLREGQTVSISLAEGNWTITITAYNTGESIGSTVSKATILAGRMTSVPITLKLNTFLIRTEEDLRRVGTEDVGWTLGANYKMVDDIDLGNNSFNNWTDPIGPSDTNPFTGTFDGNGFKISHLKIDNSGNNQGLFGYIGVGGTVKNLGLEGVEINVNGDKIGSIAGYNKGEILNCYVTGMINGTDAVGGVAGESTGAIRRCYSEAIVIGFRNLGGIVGANQVEGSLIGKVENCYTTGDIEFIGVATLSTAQSFGGIAGYNAGRIEYCYATGKVEGPRNVGGIVGHNANGTVQNCVALNSSIVRSSNSTDTYFERVIGNSSGTVPNNYARNSLNIAFVTNSASVQGTTTNDWDSADWWRTAPPGRWSVTGAWKPDSWNFNNVGSGNLPTLIMPGNPTQNPVVQQ